MTSKRVIVGDHTFNSDAEAGRYVELKILEREGGITNLAVHPRFILVEGFNRVVEGQLKWERPVLYEPSFSYTQMMPFALIVEDVIKVETRVFQLKRRLFWRKYLNSELRIILV